jgi:flagellar biosynthesis component FlhA
MLTQGKTKGNVVLPVVICQALVLILPVGNTVLSVVICQVLVLPLGSIMLSVVICHGPGLSLPFR